MLLVIAGTSGAGKGAIVTALRQRFPELWYSVSATTRPPRPGESEGRDYFFLSREAFERLRDDAGLLEWFDVYGELKGTPKAPVMERLERGEDVLLEVDAQGALAVRAAVPDATLVFVRAPSREEQRRRLTERPNEEGLDVEARIAAADWEESVAPEFDFVVVNDDLDRAVDEVATILRNSHPRD